MSSGWIGKGYSANSPDFDQVNQVCLTLKTLALSVNWPDDCDDGTYRDLSDRWRCRRSSVRVVRIGRWINDRTGPGVRAATGGDHRKVCHAPRNRHGARRHGHHGSLHHAASSSSRRSRLGVVLAYRPSGCRRSDSRRDLW